MYVVRVCTEYGKSAFDFIFEKQQNIFTKYGKLIITFYRKQTLHTQRAWPNKTVKQTTTKRIQFIATVWVVSVLVSTHFKMKST